jgi:hypothetical protein
MEHAPVDQEHVKSRSEMFLGCIDEVSHPSKLKTFLSQFYGDE